MLDCNVVLDVLLDRQPHSKASSAIWAEVERKRIEGFVAAHAVTTIHYLLQKSEGNARGKRIVRMLLEVLRVAPVDEEVLRLALGGEEADFEDAVTEAAARAQGCEVIVTRDPKGFRKSNLEVVTPEVLLGLMRKR